jgi:hypothetical protein
LTDASEKRRTSSSGTGASLAASLRDSLALRRVRPQPQRSDGQGVHVLLLEGVGKLVVVDVAVAIRVQTLDEPLEIAIIQRHTYSSHTR